MDVLLGTSGVPGQPSPSLARMPCIVRSALAGLRGDAWQLKIDEFWAVAYPPAHTPRQQGWKIHVSAAREAAPAVLARVARVAAEEKCAFKFPRDCDHVRLINSRDLDRGSVGKFITLYPRDDDHFVTVAKEAHAATAGLPGPLVLSDRAYCAGSLVHYRYGGFTGGGAELSLDGVWRRMVTGPNGERSEDRRTVRAAPPAWAADPFGGQKVTASARQPGKVGVLLGGRYVLRRALRHAAKGGVFVGTDTATGNDVVVKQARAHIEVDSSGREACAALRHEATMMALLAPAGLTPRPLSLIERERQLFLVQERVPGRTLDAWVSARLDSEEGPGVPWPQAAVMARALIGLVRQAHALGVAVGDLAPGNVLVRPDDTLRLIDLEQAARAREAVGGAGTPGYQAPERTAASLPGAVRAAALCGDLFSLGGLLFLLSTGHHPPGGEAMEDRIPTAVSATRPAPDGDEAVPERLGPWLASTARYGHTARELAPLVLGLRRAQPGLRCSLARAHAAVEAAAKTGNDRPPARSRTSCRPGLFTAIDQILADGIFHLAATATPDHPYRLWPTTPGGETTDPCNVQHGAAGVLALLARAAATPTLPGDVRATARDTTRLAAAWITRHPVTDDTALPGLYFGRSGTAWALLDAADLLTDPTLLADAEELAVRVPLRWPNPDIAHGAAGAGMLSLRMAAVRSTYLERADHCARELLARMHPTPHGPVWTVPHDFSSAFAGQTHLGYAHGAAGIGAFLLAVADATGTPAYRKAALRAGHTLATTARTAQDGPRHAAWWPRSADDAAHIRLSHWCSGSAGAGTFLLRLWQATATPWALDLASAAGQAVLRERWHATTAFCHGLAGSGELLLDLATATGSQYWNTAARALADQLTTRCTTRQGRLVPLDETGRGCGTGYGAGIAGVLAFLLRLRHGGLRLWEPPTLGDRAPQTCGTATTQPRRNTITPPSKEEP
ncbi:class IV lanthionine synthetase LanL [Streptomyces aureoversilis]|uniref:Class IV lanthionine synthetase LanL n=1 Tax=Streptomyces aureoversilis TaxID=67277 RepID=A0ABW0A5B8_9ACTN